MLVSKTLYSVSFDETKKLQSTSNKKEKNFFFFAIKKIISKQTIRFTKSKKQGEKYPAIKIIAMYNNRYNKFTKIFFFTSFCVKTNFLIFPMPGK